MSIPTESFPTITASQDIWVEKFVEMIDGKIIGSVSGYNYSDHDPNKEGEYYSWALEALKGNAYFIIPAGSPYKFDPFQKIFVSNKIKFVKFKEK